MLMRLLDDPTVENDDGRCTLIDDVDPTRDTTGDGSALVTFGFRCGSGEISEGRGRGLRADSSRIR